jgi:catechol 2,3-dioxygenase-like lactoylglutathione lyase family enzyme
LTGGALRSALVARHTMEVAMGKIRHIAIQVPELEKAAAFYEGVFGLTRVNQVNSPIGNAISLSDGIMNLTLLHFPEGTKGGKGGPEWAGLHHIGFVVEDETATEAKIKAHGGEFFMQLPSYPGVDAEKKFKDINGVVFDVAEHDWRQSKAS